MPELKWSIKIEDGTMKPWGAILRREEITPKEIITKDLQRHKQRSNIMLPFIHESQIRVRYAETDQMGVVWHGNYLQYFEVARTEALRASGWSYRSLEESGIMLPLVEAHLEYFMSARYDDLLTVRVTVVHPPTARMRFDYEIYNDTGAALVTGHTVLGFVNVTTRRPCRPPQRLRDLFAL